MKKYFLFVSLIGSLLLFNACQKEFSFEIKGISTGSLQADATGDCLPKSVQGIYEVGNTLDADSNYIDVAVNVTAIGSYRVYSDTSNGIFFQAKGVFTTLGSNTVRLVGNGIPLTAGMHHFKIKYDSTECLVVLTTLPQGGTEPSEFTLAGGPGTCLDFSLSGFYIKDIAVTDADKVLIKVNVTKIGTYLVTTSSNNGISFSGTGFFTSVGDQTITLNAIGTPLQTGSTKIDINAGGNSCSFTLDVTAGADYTIDCASAFVNGTYEEGVTLDGSNKIDIDVNVITPGPYSISTSSVSGISFFASGNFTTTGSHTISLVGQGTPAAEGSFDIDISGSSSCGFGITVNPGAATGDLKWKFTSGGISYGGATEEAFVSSVMGITSVSVGGITSAGSGSWSIAVTNTGGAVGTGTYSGTAVSGKLASFTFIDGGTTWLGMLGTGSALDIVITTYNTTDKIIEGTFGGTVTDLAGAFKTITGGSFKARLP